MDQLLLLISQLGASESQLLQDAEKLPLSICK